MLDIENKYLADFHFVTIGGEISLSQYVADFAEELNSRGISHSIHAFGTNVEADREDIFSLIAWIFDHLFSLNEKRVMVDVKLTTRIDKFQSLAEKVAAVQNKMGQKNV